MKMQLRFRRITDEDLEMIMNWRTLPDITKYLYTDFEPSMESQNKWFGEINNNPYRQDWIINVDGDDVGIVQILRIDRANSRCEWAYYLGADNVRGKGIGKNVELNVLAYVFNALKLNKLCCEVFLFNDLVIKIHEKYGSKVEGTRREHIFKNGDYYDIVEMGILKSEWENEVKNKHDYSIAEFEQPGRMLCQV